MAAVNWFNQRASRFPLRVAAGLLTAALASSAWAQGAPPMGFPPPASANAPKPNTDPRDFDGTYIGAMMGGGMPMAAFGADLTLFTDEAAPRAAKRAALMRNNQSIERPSYYCRPFNNITNAAQPLFPAKVVQTKNRIVILTEEGRGVWEIFLDRDHPKKVTPTYNGHSVGKWEGDTLVVDIVGYNGKQWMDFVSGPNSTQTHAVVRIKKIDDGKRLAFDLTMEDPKVYKRPLKQTYALVWNPDLRLLEFACEESVGIGSYPGVKEE